MTIDVAALRLRENGEKHPMILDILQKCRTNSRSTETWGDRFECLM